MYKTTESVYDKLDIAREYLDLAMQLYIEERNYFCAIHLAAVAEELFGKQLPEDKRIYNVALNAQKSMQILETSLQNGEEPNEPANKDAAHKEAHSVLNDSKNMIKHMNGPNDVTISIDPLREAAYWIERALNNFYKLKLPKSKILWKFEDYRKAQIQQELGSIK